MGKARVAQLDVSHPLLRNTHARNLRMSLLSTITKVDLMPSTLEADRRMQESKTSSCEDDHDTLEDHEHWLVAGEKVTVETTR